MVQPPKGTVNDANLSCGSSSNGGISTVFSTTCTRNRGNSSKSRPAPVEPARNEQTRRRPPARKCDCGSPQFSAQQHVIFLLVHTGRDAEHLGPEDKEGNTAQGAESQAKLAKHATNVDVTVLLVQNGHDAEHHRPVNDNRKERSARSIVTSEEKKRTSGASSSSSSSFFLLEGARRIAERSRLRRSRSFWSFTTLSSSWSERRSNGTRRRCRAPEQPRAAWPRAPSASFPAPPSPSFSSPPPPSSCLPALGP